MIKRLFTALTLLLFCSFALFAQNTLTIPSVTIAKGKSMNLPVRMNNTADIVAVQFTLTLPDGIVPNTENSALAERAAGHSLTMRSIGENQYMAVIFSSTNATIDGSAGKLLSLNLTASQTVEEGIELPMLLSDVIMSSSDGANLVTDYTAGNITVALSPDFEVSALTVEAKEANPGDNVLLKWQVANVGGLGTEAGWSEAIYLNSHDGTEKHLTTIYCEELLASGATLTRSTEIKLPELLGIDGEATFSIKLSANKGSGEQAGADGNNSTTAASAILIGKRLGLTPTLNETDEASGEKVRYYLTRSGNTNTAETFAVTATHDSRVSLPSSVTVEKGEMGAYFYAVITPNKILDENPTIEIEINGNGYPATSAQLVIKDDTKPKMSVTASTAEITEGEALGFVIGIERPLQSDLAVEFTADNKSRFKIPASIVIPAGKTTVDVQIQSVDDSTPDIEQEVTFTVYAADHQPASTGVILKDNDVPNLHIELTPDKVSESDGPLSVVARIKRTSNIDKNVRIKLSDNSEDNIYYGKNDFEMPAGVEEVTLNLGPIDNALNDGERTYFINAAVYIASCNCSAGEGTTDGIASAQLTVFDNDGPTLSLKTDKSVLVEGGQIEATVTRNTSTTDALTVSLSCDNASGIELPSSVTIPVGKTSATFNIVSLKNDDTNDGYNATITASAAGYAKGVTWFTVSDQTLPDAQITSIEASATEAVVSETVTISTVVANTGNYTLPKGTSIKFYLNSSSSAADTAFLPKDLAVGESATVNAKITLPTYIGTYNIYSVVNEEKSVKELSYANNSSKLTSIKTVSPFAISVNADKAIYNIGENVVISGVVEGKDVAEKEIEVYTINSNYRHTIKAITGQDGQFTVNYTPYNGQIGYFVLGACYPGENLRTEMASFSFYGIKRTSNAAIECEALLGDVYSGSITFSNPGILDLSDIKATVISKPEICEVTLNCPTSVKAGNEFMLNYDITPNAVSTINAWEEILIKIETKEGVSLTTTLYYHCRVKTGMLKASVSSINTTMTKGMSRDYVFDITNTGKGATGTISIDVPSWMSTVTPKDMPSLASGETTSVVLRLTPNDAMQLNVPVSGTIGLNCSNGKGLSLPYNIEPVSEETGTLSIDVCDENTYYTAEAPHLAGANVTIMHPKTSKVLSSGVTNDKGIYSVELPEGYYTIKVTADQHSSYSNNILVDPGKETYKVVNLSYEAITIDWKVEETEVKDEYSVVTTVKFETNVPVPVVELIVPKSIDADGLQPGESLIFNAVLTNKGLISAMDVQLQLPDGFNRLKFEALDHAEPFTLAPQQSVVIPVKVTKVAVAKDNSPKRVAPIDDDPCTAYPGTLYYWDCGPDRKWHRYAVVMQVGTCKSDDPSTWNPDTNGGGYYGGGRYYGPGGIGGTGGGIYSSSSGYTPVTSSEDKGCEPCQNRLIYKLSKCVVNHVPIVSDVWDIIGWIDDPVGSAKGAVKDKIEDIIAEKIPVYGWVKKIVGYKKVYDECIKPFFDECDLEAPASALHRAGTRSAYSYPSYIEEFRSKAEYAINATDATIDIINEIYGSDIWQSCEVEQLKELSEASLNFVEGNSSKEELMSKKPDAMTMAEMELYIQRLSNTCNEVGENRIDFAFISEKSKIVNASLEYCYSLGYKNLAEMYQDAESKMRSEMEVYSSSVCSSITLQFSQSMVMTRQAFLGTLTVFNGNDDKAMKDVKMALSITDQEGKVATSHEFQINPETLDGFNGALSLDAGWTLNAKSTGVATIMFIPTRYAAPENNKVYNIGGTLSYIDPFTGLEVTRTLTPVAITVKPSPVMNLTYFMQRDIKGDDPLTEEIEPCEEAEFSLLINNIGYGDATNVRMVTNQPEIVENEKGLLVDFELMSSQLNGEEKTLALGGSVATDFGTIPAKGTSYAQWWIKSSLLGHFTDYDVQATHITSYDNPDLTLLNDVTIHELIRSIEIVNGDKNLVGFMTNDIADAKDTPDMLYLSNGNIEPVGKATASISRISDTEYRLTVTPASTGWVYGNISDPTYGVSAINSIVRQSDNKEISLRNIWQTDRTMRDGKEPLYENMLHFADEFESLAPETYILTFSPTPKLQLEVIAFEGLPAEGEVAKKHVETIIVVFNKQIDPQTFTYEDISLAVQGINQDASLIKITTDDNKTFKIDLSAYNGITGNGYYVLQVQTAEITDKEGFNGKTGKSAGWIMFRDGYTSLTKSVYPEQAGSLSLTSKNENSSTAGDTGNKTVNLTYGETYILTATANEGYNFLNWSIDGVVISEQPQIEYLALNDVEIVANFAFKTYSVEVESTADGGSIIGTSTGVYNHGTELSFTAIPDKDYAFEHWCVNGEEAGSQPTLTLTVDKPFTVSAVFKKEYYNQELAFSKGWNWISSYLSEPVSVAELANNSERIIGQFDEVVKEADELVGGFDYLDKGCGYKVLASKAFTKELRGHLNDSSLSLKSGWNWIAYPYYESKPLSATVTNAENGDLLISQKGFAEYADGNWEGTLTELVPGCGYIYKSVSDKTLQLQFDSQTATDERPAAAPSLNLGRVDYEYPNTMNIIARIYQDEQFADDDTYEIYAMIGDDYRGYGQKVGENYYITVYGDESVDISFIILNSSTGATFKAYNTMPFTNDVIGSRISPYKLAFENTPSGIGTIFNQDDRFKVYSIEGILISNNASIEELHKLPKGIYIVNGSKYIAK